MVSLHTSPLNVRQRFPPPLDPDAGLLLVEAITTAASVFVDPARERDGAFGAFGCGCHFFSIGRIPSVLHPGQIVDGPATAGRMVDEEELLDAVAVGVTDTVPSHGQHIKMQRDFLESRGCTLIRVQFATSGLVATPVQYGTPRNKLLGRVRIVVLHFDHLWSWFQASCTLLDPTEVIVGCLDIIYTSLDPILRSSFL